MCSLKESSGLDLDNRSNNTRPSFDRITTRITANNNPGRIGRLDNEAECVRALTYVREGEA